MQNTEAPDIGAPDERQHANYIEHLLSQHSFPVLRIGDSEQYEAHQPPLYYLVGACWAKFVGVETVSAPSVGFRLRLLNALIGALGVLGVAYLAKRVSQKESVTVIATGFAALIPMNAALSGAVSNDPLLICLCIWTLGVMAKVIREGWNWSAGGLLGLLAGLALLTKTTGIALLPVLLLGCFFITDRTVLRRLLYGGLVCIMALLIASPWLVRNQNLYGDPFALRAFNNAFAQAMHASTMIEIFGAVQYWKTVFWGTSYSFFGVFGYWDIFLPLQIYWLLGLTVLSSFIGWMISIKKEPENLKMNLVNFAFTVLIVVLFLRFNMQYFQAQGRYLLPALGPIATGFGLGMNFLSKKRTMVVAAVLGSLLFLLNVGILRMLPAEFAARITPQTDSAQLR